MSSTMPWAAALCVSIALSGCVQPTEPNPSARPLARQGAPEPGEAKTAASGRAPRLSTSVEFVRTLVTGDTATAVLFVTNHEKESVTLRFPHSCQLLYVVYDRHGTEVSLGWSCWTFGSTLTLEPGKTVQRRLKWRAVRWDDSQYGYVPLPTGPYRMHAYLDKWGYMSPPFAVRLVEPASNIDATSW